MICLLRRLKIKWQDKVRDTEILSRANQPSVYTLLMRAQVRWAGHVAHMPDKHIPKQLLSVELADGKRSVGGQKKRFKDTLKASLKSFDIDIDTWDKVAVDHPTWCSLTKKGRLIHEERITAGAKKKQELRKSRAASSSTSVFIDSSLVCSTCGRSFKARIGLNSHFNRTHRIPSSNLQVFVKVIIASDGQTTSGG